MPWLGDRDEYELTLNERPLARAYSIEVEYCYADPLSHQLDSVTVRGPTGTRIWITSWDNEDRLCLVPPGVQLMIRSRREGALGILYETTA